MKEYKKLMAKKEGREIHTNFLASQKMIDNINNDVLRGHGKISLQDRGDLMEVHKTMQVEQVRSSGFQAPQKQFILESRWDENSMARGTQPK